MEYRSLMTVLLWGLSKSCDSLIDDMIAVCMYWMDARRDYDRFSDVVQDLKNIRGIENPMDKFKKITGTGGPLNALHHSGPIADYFYLPPNHSDRELYDENNNPLPYTGLSQTFESEQIKQLRTLDDLNNLHKTPMPGTDVSYETGWQNWLDDVNKPTERKPHKMTPEEKKRYEELRPKLKKFKPRKVPLSLEY